MTFHDLVERPRRWCRPDRRALPDRGKPWRGQDDAGRAPGRGQGAQRRTRPAGSRMCRWTGSISRTSSWTGWAAGTAGCAPDTFRTCGYAALLGRLRDEEEDDIVDGAGLPADLGAAGRRRPGLPQRPPDHHRGQLPPARGTGRGRAYGHGWTRRGSAISTRRSAYVVSSPATRSSAARRHGAARRRHGPAQRRPGRRDTGPSTWWSAGRSPPPQLQRGFPSVITRGIPISAQRLGADRQARRCVCEGGASGPGEP